METQEAIERLIKIFLKSSGAQPSYMNCDFLSLNDNSSGNY